MREGEGAGKPGLPRVFPRRRMPRWLGKRLRRPQLHITIKLVLVASLILIASVSINLYTLMEGYYKRAEGPVFEKYDEQVLVYNPDKPLFPLRVNTVEGPLKVPVEGKINIFVPQYVNCPDICHFQTMIMVYVMNRTVYEGIADDIVWITIDVDPQRSTPDAVKSYIRGALRQLYGKVEWHWILDSEETMRRLYLLFDMIVQKDPETGLVGHTAGFFIVDGEGRLNYYVRPRTWEDPVGVGNALYEIIEHAVREHAASLAGPSST